MGELSKLLVGLVAVLHFCFLVLEMFLWTRPFGLKIFKQSKQRAQDTAALAMNQGLYNGFLSAGLIWGLLQAPVEFSVKIVVFFLVCVITAGIFGACTANKSILYIQAVPEFVALISLLI